MAKCSSGNKFEQVVKNTNDIAQGYQPGLQAIEAQHKGYIVVKSPRLLCGSVNIDKEVEKFYPNEHRWDYAICYDGKVFFVEIHSANTSNIAEMEKKLKWLKNWLKTKAPLLEQFPASSSKRFYWVTMGSGVHISKQSSYHRKLVQLNLLPNNPPLSLG